MLRLVNGIMPSRLQRKLDDALEKRLTSPQPMLCPEVGGIRSEPLQAPYHSRGLTGEAAELLAAESM